MSNIQSLAAHFDWWWSYEFHEWFDDHYTIKILFFYKQVRELHRHIAGKIE